MKNKKLLFLSLLSGILLLGTCAAVGCTQKKTPIYDDPNLIFEDCFDGNVSL